MLGMVRNAEVYARIVVIAVAIFVVPAEGTPIKLNPKTVDC